MKKQLLDRRLAQIKSKLAALPPTEQVTLDPPLTEQRVSGFEDSHSIRLPEAFRQFILHIGHAGYGPTYGLLPIDKWLGMPIGGSKGLASPFPFVPDAEVSAPAASGIDAAEGVFPGSITVVHRGCSDFTLLVVTGPGRGRLVEVNAEGFFPPRFSSDSDFLAWYERWLDFVLAGHRGLTWFADQMAGDEAELVATLVNSPVTAHRRAAACTFITYPTPSASLPEVLAQALLAEPQVTVKEAILRALSAQGDSGRDLLPTALPDRAPSVRSLAAILMTTSTRQGRRLAPHLRRILDAHLEVETDRSVRDTIKSLLI
ncbi:SMI1/KNR4 family protein [Nucisporomicrobium flavum]|uniref:SMI1/KNR4 family protein n=1 Tax=Nucisporomicrobium flavum TaxID=2785915 RepID=UPI0018F5A6BF|nr:SMI1/KNR4 family protein [Nucisporomicrobium flavum]